jgi:ABC-type Fe3+ transport system substrate-binding protein
MAHRALWRARSAWASILLGLLACAPGASLAPTQPAARHDASAAAVPASPAQPLIDGARQEGQLAVQWSEGTLGGTRGVRQLAEGFNRQYGLNLDVRFTPGPPYAEMAARVSQEFQAGRPASTDVLVGYASQIVVPFRVGALAAVDWAGWAPHVQDPRLVAPNGMAVIVQSSTLGITYNSAKLTGEAAPRSLGDLLKPQYNGRIASTPYGAGFDYLATDELWGSQRTFDYVARLAEQVAGLMGCPETERIVTGEFDVLALDCNQANSLMTKAKGAPIAFAIAADAPLLQVLYLTVPAHAAHPNAAKLWLNYLLSREAQDALVAQDYQDNHLLPGSKTARELEALQAAGVATTIDLEFVLRQDDQEFGRRRVRVQELLRQSGTR